MIAHVLVFLALTLAEAGQPPAPPPPGVTESEAPEGPTSAKTDAQAALALGNKRLKEGDVAGAANHLARVLVGDVRDNSRSHFATALNEGNNRFLAAARMTHIRPRPNISFIHFHRAG